MAKKPPKDTGDAPDPADSLRFEDALGDLERIVRELEEGQLGLDDALRRYEQGVKLLRRCYDLLQGAERRIELLSGLDAYGNPITEPFDDQATRAPEEKAKRRSTRPSPAEGDEPAEEAAPDRSPRRSDVDAPGGLV